jgi:hypothetical protein
MFAVCNLHVWKWLEGLLRILRRKLCDYLRCACAPGVQSILGQYDLNYSIALAHVTPSWLIWVEIEYTVHVVQPKQPINFLNQVGKADNRLEEEPTVIIYILHCAGVATLSIIEQIQSESV